MAVNVQLGNSNQLLMALMTCVAAGCSGEPGPTQLSERPAVAAAYVSDVKVEVLNSEQRLDDRLECLTGSPLTLSFECPKRIGKVIESVVVQVIMKHDNGKETVMDSSALTVVPAESPEIVRIEGEIKAPKAPGRYLLYAVNPAGETVLNRELLVISD